MSWRQIATAPKDGTRILACMGPPRETPPPDYDWSYAPVTVSWRCYHPNAKGKLAWRDPSGIKQEYVAWWMPLPKPPAPARGEGE